MITVRRRMTGLLWADLLIGVAARLPLTWLALIIALVIVRPRAGLSAERSDGFKALARLTGLHPSN